MELGVHLAQSEDARARRLATLSAVSATYVPSSVGDRVASTFAELVATTRRAGRRIKVQDAWIAATARAHSAAIFTQDADFDHLPGVEAIRV